MRLGRSTLKDVFLGGPLLGTRMWLVLGSLTWAIFLLLPSSTYPGSTCHLMSRIAPNYVWSTAFFIQGLWAYYTLRTGVRNVITLFMDAFLGATLWTSATILSILSTYPIGVSFTQAVGEYTFPAGMASQVILNLASLWHMVNYWAEEPCKKYPRPIMGFGSSTRVKI